MKNPIYEDLQTLDDTSSALKALHNLLVRALETGEDLKPESTGVYQMFNDLDDRLERLGEKLRQHVSKLAVRATDAQASRAADLDLWEIDPHSGQGARRKLVSAVLRLTNYAHVAERYALPAETFRDMLYGLVDAPAKEMRIEGMREVGTGPGPDWLEYAGLEPDAAGEQPSVLHGPIPEHFLHEALADRLTASVDTERVAKAVNLKPETVQRVIDQLLAEPGQRPATGTDG